MNPEELISKEELLLTGWTERQIDAALDEPDEVGPSGHWRNTSGKPYFDRDRVAVAAYKIGLKNEKPLHAQWSKWNLSNKPSALPLLTVDFYHLAEATVKGASRQFSSLRASHPVLGRQNGTRDKERLLIEEILIKLVMDASGVELPNLNALHQYLSERSAHAPESLGDHWPKDVVFRAARRSSYVSKASGEKSKQRFLDVISLVHAGLVQGVDGKKVELIDLLISSPRLRFDRRWGNELGGSKNSYHVLHHRELPNSPGRNESVTDFVCYGGDNRWELLTDATDDSGRVQVEPVRQLMGTVVLVKWTLQRDEESEQVTTGSSPCIEDAEEDAEANKRILGTTASRLREIASDLNAGFCIACLDGWLAGTWPTPRKEMLRIHDIRGVTKRGVWIRIFHAVYDVDTNLGPGYLYPPDANGSAKFILKSGSTASESCVVSVPKRLLPKIEALKPALALLLPKKIPGNQEV